MRRIKSKIIGLQYEYNRASRKDQVAVTWNGKTCILNVSGQVYKMSNRDAYEFLKIHINELPVRNPKSKGYVGKSMSVNAKCAYAKGLKPISRFTVQDLKQHGFPYSLAFFKWLVHRNYIRPTEVHHTSAVYNKTSFYNGKAVAYALRYFNLDLLYDIYIGKITMEDAAKKRGITYVKVKISGALLGSRKETLAINGILCDAVVFYSPRLCFKYNEEKVALIGQYDDVPANFENPYLEEMLELF